MAKITPQNYPRIDDVANRYNGFLNEDTLVPHKYKISVEELKRLISSAIINASKKSSRQILSLPPNASESEVSERLSYLLDHGFIFKNSNNGKFIFSANTEKLTQIVENSDTFNATIEGLEKMDSYLN